jgi:hypothetical protein
MMKPMGAMSSKPAFAMGGKKPAGLGTKPTFAIKKKAQAVDDLIENEMSAISQKPSFASPEKPMRPPSSVHQEID